MSLFSKIRWFGQYSYDMKIKLLSWIESRHIQYFQQKKTTDHLNGICNFSSVHPWQYRSPCFYVYEYLAIIKWYGILFGRANVICWQKRCHLKAILLCIKSQALSQASDLIEQWEYSWCAKRRICRLIDKFSSNKSFVCTKKTHTYTHGCMQTYST